MDTLTHALTGALAGRAITGSRSRVMSPRAAAVAGAVAAGFPDLDIVLTWFGQFTYLQLHQGLTHSLPMLPLWAVMLAWVFARAHRGRTRTYDFLPITASALLLHVLADLCNTWGLLLWWPLSDARYALDAVFVIDPLYTTLVVGGLAMSVLWRVRAGAVIGLGAIVLYTGFALVLSAKVARDLEASPGLASASLQVYAAPPWLANRRVVVVAPDGWSYAYLDLSAEVPRASGDGWWSGLRAGFRPANALEWQHALHPDHAGAFVQMAWHQPALAPFRRFLTVPYVHAVEADGDLVCAWFSDLRFTLPAVRQPFIWGACRGTDGAWVLRQRGRW